MNLLIFKTDIENKEKVETIKPFLNNHSNIIKWTIDLDDIDNVLKVKFKKDLTENDIIKTINTQGFYCDVLDY